MLGVGRVARLELFVKVEIKNINPILTKEEVLEAMRKAIPVYAVDRNAKKTATEVTKLWSLNSRYQIITLRTTRWLLNDVDKV